MVPHRCVKVSPWGVHGKQGFYATLRNTESSQVSQEIDRGFAPSPSVTPLSGGFKPLFRYHHLCSKMIE
jgi:hypothetical protein